MERENARKKSAFMGRLNISEHIAGKCRNVERKDVRARTMVQIEHKARAITNCVAEQAIRNRTNRKIKDAIEKVKAPPV